MCCDLTGDYFFACQSLLETHDSVASQTCESPPPSPCDFVDHAPEEDKEHTPYPPPDAIRMVGIRKVAGEHLVGCNNILCIFTSSFFFFVEDKTWAAWLNCGYWLNHLISPFSLFQGVTFKVEAGELTIARILHGGIVDQQGLLHVGDVIKEVRRSKAGSTECTGWLCWDRHPFF